MDGVELVAVVDLIRERAEELGGRAEVDSAPARGGTPVVVEVPLELSRIGGGEP